MRPKPVRPAPRARRTPPNLAIGCLDVEPGPNPCTPLGIGLTMLKGWNRKGSWGAYLGPGRPFSFKTNHARLNPAGRSDGGTRAASISEGGKLMWSQVYNPLGNAALSTLVAALPVVTLLVLIASGKVKAHVAALIALLVAILVAVILFTMPAGLAIRASILGAVIGFFPIGWIVLNVIFMYRLTVEKGAFETLQPTIGGGTTDPP